MKKFFTFAALAASVTLAHAQQIPNGGFGQWKEQAGNSYQSSSGSLGGKQPEGMRQRPGIEPLEWNGSSVNQKVLMEAKATLVEKGTSESTNYATLTNKFVGAFGIGANAPAYLTFGTPWVYAVMDLPACDGGTYGGMDFAFRPDAIKGRFKRPKGTVEEQAHIIAYLWKGTFTSNIPSVKENDTKEDEDRAVLGKKTSIQSGVLIASCDHVFTSTKNDDWEEITVPLNYVQGQENTIPEKMNIIISSADYWNRQNIQENSQLLVDDLEYLYYSELASLNYNGKDYFQQDNTNYTIDELYDESKLTCTSNGKGATIEKSYDEASAVLTLTVKGNDVSVNPSNVHTYKVQFKKPQPIITSYTNSLMVRLENTYFAPTVNTIDLIQETDKSYSLLLKNFNFNDLPIGDIKVTDLVRTEEGNTVVYTAENQMVEVGEMGKLPVTLSARQEGDELIADIQIALGEEMVTVTFLPALDITGNDELTNVSEGRYNVTYSRRFEKGWSTVCLPYATTPELLGAGSVQAFDSADESGLNFVEVDELKENEPYLAYFDHAVTSPAYQDAEITSTTPVSVTKGDYTFTGSYDAVISMSGKYGVATIDDVQKIILGGENSTLKATRAYFTKKGEQPAQVRINLFGEDGNGTTGIGQVENSGAQAYDVYTLQGVQVLKGAESLNGLQKGIYIVNGTKVVIK